MNEQGADPSARAPGAGPDGPAGGVQPHVEKLPLDGQFSVPYTVIKSVNAWLQPRSRKRTVLVVVCAGVVAVWLAYALNQALDLSLLRAILSGIVAGILTLLVNWIHVTRVDGDKWVSPTLINTFFVITLAVIIGATLSLATTSLFFHETVFAEWENSDTAKKVSAKRKEGIQLLKGEKDELEKKIKYPARRSVDEDPEVKRLFTNYQQAKNELDEAYKEYKCAIEDTCIVRVNNREQSLSVRFDWYKTASLNSGQAYKLFYNAWQDTKRQIDSGVDRAVAADQLQFDVKSKHLIELIEDQGKADSSPPMGSFIGFIFRGGLGLICFIGMFVLWALVAALPTLYQKDGEEKIQDEKILKKREMEADSDARRTQADLNLRDANHGRGSVNSLRASPGDVAFDPADSRTGSNGLTDEFISNGRGLGDKQPKTWAQYSRDKNSKKPNGKLHRAFRGRRRR